MTVIGCECGLVNVAIINIPELKICQSWKLRYDKPICSVSIFPLQNNIGKPSFINSKSKFYYILNIYIYIINNLIIILL